MFENKDKKTILKSEKRFIVKSTYNLGVCGVQIIVDKETGVNYLMVGGNNITPLLDSEGKVVIDTLMEYK